MKVSVTTKGFDGLLEMLESLTIATGSVQDPVIASLLSKLADAYRKALYNATPEKSNLERGNSPKGYLRSSIEVNVDKQTGMITASYGAPYAIYILNGVSAQYMKWLVGSRVTFVAKSGQRISRYVSYVGISNGKRHWYHPGTPPKNPFDDAWKAQEVQDIIAELQTEGLLTSIGYGFAPTASISP